MKTRRLIIATAILLLGIGVVSPMPTVANGDDKACLPGIETAVRRNPLYKHLYRILAANRDELQELLAAVVDQSSYQRLLSAARSLAMEVEAGRVVITLPDGTVVVDTAATDDPANALATGNSFVHFSRKTVNENHNSRIAILATQLYPCGLGLERKLSTTTNETESYLALRLGRHLDSIGTARLSTKQGD